MCIDVSSVHNTECVRSPVSCPRSERLREEGVALRRPEESDPGRPAGSDAQPARRARERGGGAHAGGLLLLAAAHPAAAAPVEGTQRARRAEMKVVNDL